MIRDIIDKIKNFFTRKFSRGLNFQRRRRRIKPQEIRSYAINVGIITGIVLLAFLLVFTFFTGVRNNGVSMQPTIEDETNLLINRGSYLIFSPKHNQIIAFESLSNEQDNVYVKRVVGVPGDTIKIKNGRLYVNDEKYDDVAETEAIQYKGIAEDEITLEDDQYFVLGDNRNNSEDSRYQSVGLISKSQIKGRVWFKLSFGDFGIVN